MLLVEDTGEGERQWDVPATPNSGDAGGRISGDVGGSKPGDAEDA